MLDVEEYIVQIAIQLAKMQAPISQREGLELANSLIQGTSVGEKVKAWKQQNCLSYIQDKGKNAPLGTKYWKGFMK